MAGYIPLAPQGAMTEARQPLLGPEQRSTSVVGETVQTQPQVPQPLMVQPQMPQTVQPQAVQLQPVQPLMVQQQRPVQPQQLTTTTGYRAMLIPQKQTNSGTYPAFAPRAYGRHAMQSIPIQQEFQQQSLQPVQKTQINFQQPAEHTLLIDETACPHTRARYGFYGALFTIFCCLMPSMPCGLAALVNSVKARSAAMYGDMHHAYHHASRAKKWIIAGILIGIIYRVLVLAAIYYAAHHGPPHGPPHHGPGMPQPFGPPPPFGPHHPFVDPRAPPADVVHEGPQFDGPPRAPPADVIHDGPQFDGPPRALPVDAIQEGQQFDIIIN